MTVIQSPTTHSSYTFTLPNRSHNLNSWLWATCTIIQLCQSSNNQVQLNQNDLPSTYNQTGIELVYSKVYQICTFGSNRRKPLINEGGKASTCDLRGTVQLVSKHAINATFTLLLSTCVLIKLFQTLGVSIWPALLQNDLFHNDSQCSLPNLSLYLPEISVVLKGTNKVLFLFALFHAIFICQKSAKFR